MKQILIVDDSATSRLLFRAYMPKELDANILEADGMDTALRLTCAGHLDVVFMDYNMPDYNGVEVAKAMRARGIDARFVLLTANTQAAVVQSAQRAGFSAIVDKPVTREKLAKALQCMT